MLRSLFAFIVVFCVLEFTLAGDWVMSVVPPAPTAVPRAAPMPPAEAQRQPSAPPRYLNPDVTRATYQQTICVPGYTATVRPAANYTQGIKLKLLRERNEPPSNAALYELDHVVPLALGGHPRAPDNLMLQAWPEARRKDRLEAKLWCMVCAGQLDLDEARAAIRADWQAAYRQYASAVCHRDRRHEARADIH